MIDRSFQALFGIWDAGSGKLLSSSLSRLDYRGVELAYWLLGIRLCRAKVMVRIMMVMTVVMGMMVMLMMMLTTMICGRQPLGT